MSNNKVKFITIFLTGQTHFITLRFSHRYLLSDIRYPSGSGSWGRSSVGRAPALQAGGHRFDPDRLHHVNQSTGIPEYRLTCIPEYQNSAPGDVAQLGERVVRNDEAVGSIPIISTKQNTGIPEYRLTCIPEFQSKVL